MKVWVFAAASSILTCCPLEVYAQVSNPILPVPRKNDGKKLAETPLLDAVEMTLAPSSYSKVFADAVLAEKKADALIDPSLADYFAGTPSPPLNYFWHSPSFCHHPLYFEQPNYERYGNKNHKLTSPIYSASHFYGSVLLFPLKALRDRPLSCTCTLGNQRPGDCVHLKPVLKRPKSHSHPSHVTVRLTDN